MQEYQEYLKQQSEKLSAYFENLITILENNMQLELNQKMLQNIEFAKERIEKQSQKYIDSFKESIKKLIEKRETGKLSDRLFEFNVKVCKRFLENELETTITSWQNYINDCQANMK